MRKGEAFASARLLTHNDGRQAYRVVTESGVVAYVALGIDQELMRALAEKLRKKLVRSGHLPAAKTRARG